MSVKAAMTMTTTATPPKMYAVLLFDVPGVVVLVELVEPVLVLALDDDVVVAALTTTEVTKGLMSFEVDELAKMFSR